MTVHALHFADSDVDAPFEYMVQFNLSARDEDWRWVAACTYWQSDPSLLECTIEYTLHQGYAQRFRRRDAEEIEAMLKSWKTPARLERVQFLYMGERE